MEIINRKVNDLIPYDKNPRKNDEAVKYVKESIEQFGFKVPIVIDADGVIVAGHTRLKAAKELGMKEVPCIVADDLNEEQIKAYRLADNMTASKSEWDIELLNTELLDLEANFDMSDFGFEIYPPTGEVSDDDFDADAVADAITEPVTKLGDIWTLGRHRLMCGDSTDRATVDRLMDGAKADMVFTDPPYGMNLDTDFSSMPSSEEMRRVKHMKEGKKYEKVIGDNEDFKPELITSIFENYGYCNEIFVWGADYYPELLKDYKKGNMIVWDKKTNEGLLNNNFDKTFSSTFEICWSKNKHKKDIIRILWVGPFGTEQEFDHRRHHPTQKPTLLAKWFIEKYSHEEDIIADIYGGSGSTMIACEQLNRTCYMMELDPKYCDVIVKRWETLTGQKAVLDG